MHMYDFPVSVPTSTNARWKMHKWSPHQKQRPASTRITRPKFRPTPKLTFIFSTFDNTRINISLFIYLFKCINKLTIPSQINAFCKYKQIIKYGWPLYNLYNTSQRRFDVASPLKCSLARRRRSNTDFTFAHIKLTALDSQVYTYLGVLRPHVFLLFVLFFLLNYYVVF